MTVTESNPSLQTNPRLDQWVRFNADRTVSVFSGKVELGQGIETAIAQIAAEELGVSLSRVLLVAGDTTTCPDERYTAGSQSIEVGGAAMRHVCAEVRHLFVETAARRFEVDSADLRILDGRIHLPGTDVATTYWELASTVSLARPITGTAIPVEPANHTIVGRSATRRDVIPKITGAAFVHDMHIPGMVHARVVSPPTLGAELAYIDEAAVLQAQGVLAIVRSGSFLAVVAEREEQAVSAITAAEKAARWVLPAPIAPSAEIVEHLAGLPSQSSVAYKTDAPTRAVAQRFEATYARPYIAHASIGVCAALAVLRDGRLTVWSHTQGPYYLRGEIAKALGLALDKVDVIHQEGAGCYGHNGADDVALDAALVARAVGRPVLLQWTREQEFRRAPCGSAMAVKVSVGVDADGHIVEWTQEIWSHTHMNRPGWGDGINLIAAWNMDPPMPPPPPRDVPLPPGGAQRNSVPLYAVPSQQVLYHFVPAMPIRVSALRGLGAFANVFAIESMLDEIAAARGEDPLALRLRHLADDRAKAVILAAAQAARWTHGQPAVAGCGRGIGFARYKNVAAYCAVIAELEVTEKLRVRKCWAAVDAGQVVNPDGLNNQVEGGIVQAVSWTLKEAVSWTQDGNAVRSWEDYPILRFDEAPEIDVTILHHPELPPLGAGECAAGPTAAAIANALQHALGVRARHLPFTPERVAAAM